MSETDIDSPAAQRFVANLCAEVLLPEPERERRLRTAEAVKSKIECFKKT